MTNLYKLLVADNVDCLKEDLIGSVIQLFDGWCRFSSSSDLNANYAAFNALPVFERKRMPIGGPHRLVNFFWTPLKSFQITLSAPNEYLIDGPNHCIRWLLKILHHYVIVVFSVNRSTFQGYISTYWRHLWVVELWVKVGKVVLEVTDRAEKR